MNIRILRLPEVIKKTGVSRSGIYGKLSHNPSKPTLHDPTFPKPVQLGPRSMGFIESEVDGWLEQRIANRENKLTAISR